MEPFSLVFAFVVRFFKTRSSRRELKAFVETETWGGGVIKISFPSSKKSISILDKNAKSFEVCSNLYLD